MSATNRVMSAQGPAKDDDHPLLAQEIPGYRLLRLIGKGAMGVVFEALAIAEQRRVAVKMLHTQLAHSQALVARFEREALAAALPQHPGVVKVFDVGKTTDGISFIVMEYLDGMLLSKCLLRCAAEAAACAHTDRVPAHAAEMFIIARQIAETLTVVHAKDVVHRDLKPDNIILVPDPSASGGERAKICDFGIAKLLGNPGGASAGADSAALPLALTAVGTIMGTPVYMSPEQWRGGTEITDRADVYAAGCIFYELMVGRPPFTAKTDVQLMCQHIGEPPPPIRDKARWVPAPLAELIESMLHKTPHERPSMQAVADSLAMPQCQPVPRRKSAEPSAPAENVRPVRSKRRCAPVVVPAVSLEAPTRIIGDPRVLTAPAAGGNLPEPAAESPPPPQQLQQSLTAPQLSQSLPEPPPQSSLILRVFGAWVVSLLLMGMAALLLAPGRHP